MFQERCYERDNDVNNNFFADNMTNNVDIDVNNEISGNVQTMGCSCQRPLIEPMQERCVHRTIMHEVPQV